MSILRGARAVICLPAREWIRSKSMGADFVWNAHELTRISKQIGKHEATFVRHLAVIGKGLAAAFQGAQRLQGAQAEPNPS